LSNSSNRKKKKGRKKYFFHEVDFWIPQERNNLVNISKMNALSQ